ncbi:protein insensitive [Drosophila sulfurigaster albostrigata]|uniref:protein insensitive n=1 Tax=Drosophila sulfurigaster albostrigata TaxID=89887 RepID=UPI002D21C399|nr:protein insensitive [Drosophila sulfurigaster albostrigata]
MSFCPVDAHLTGSEQRRRRTAAWIGTMDARIMQANGGTFQWSPEREQPMLLNAWTQTESEDFELLRRLEPKDPSLQAENHALRDKLRYLETKLQQHTDLLSQIHATSARMQLATVQTTPSTPPTAQQQLLTPPSSVICAPAAVAAPIAPAPVPIQLQQQPQRAEVIDYKIVTAADDADAIEIRLAAESLNSLSTSADSDRLEICLGGEEQQVIKRRKVEQPKTSTPAPLQQSNNNVYKLPTRRSNNKNNNNNHNISSNNNNNSLKIKEEVVVKEQQQQQQQLNNEVMVSIGPNNTCVPASVFENINWSVSSLATRKLLVTIFDRETLATHSMTGKPSPAFKDQQKPLKQMLDPVKIQDIIFAVTHKSNASEKEVRNAITTKCADENKMMKIQKGKRCSLVGNDKENMP